jgi:glycosyltransferase involved in cell wall biosynthesis
MKVVHMVPGSGGTFYCQNCLRDSALVPALRAAGVDAVIMPLYLPLGGGGVDQGRPVFFGGINAWLQQEMPLFRHTPRWLDRLFDSRWMLKRAARMEGTTSPEELGPMQLSMLMGGEGNQRKEVERVIAFLRDVEKPDLVHLSNVLLVGLAKEIKAALGVPVVCTLQDEEGWLDAIQQPWRKACWDLLQKRCAFVDQFIAVSAWYGEQMQVRLKIPAEKLSVVHVGIPLEGYEQAPLRFDPPVLGFLSRMNATLGLDRLVDAFLVLKQLPELESLKLMAMGGQVGDDIRFVEGLKAKIKQAGFEQDATFFEGFSREERQAFLRRLSVLSVPVGAGEAFGSYILEALACGVPVVQPHAGAFPELIRATGGGLIYEGRELVDTLEGLLLDPAEARALGARGRKAVFEQFSVERMAEQVKGLYAGLGR